MNSRITGRRFFLITAAASALVVASIAATKLDARTAAPEDKWLKNATGKHRQLFDFPASNGGTPLVHMMNYYDTWNKAYSVPDKDINVIGTFYGSTTFHGVNDAMWAKYKLGEFLNEKDGSGAPYTRNPWRAVPVVMGMEVAPASVESLQKRGATFILCNNALGILTEMLAKARGLDAKVVYEDMKANILPGVELIPGMVVAIEQAQKAGISYHRQ
jgi:intracellular sulfur oxidation DsrE/DsrF family protein